MDNKNKNKNPLGPILLALMAILCAGPADAYAQFQPCGNCTLIDNFDSKANISPWQRETSTATAGNLSLVPGPAAKGKALRLTYDLRGGGAYVAATRATPAISAAVLWLSLRSPPGIRVSLRIRDDTGQTLQYDLIRPIDAIDAGQWYRQAIDLSYPNSHYGGRNDGIVHGSIRSLWIAATGPIERLGSGLTGTIDIDDLYAVPTRVAWINPFSPYITPAPAAMSDMIHQQGISIYENASNVVMAYQLGFRNVRIDLPWRGVQAPPLGSHRYSVTGYDNVIAAAAARQMTVHVIVGYGWNDYAVPPRTDQEKSDFAGYLQAIAAHLRGQPVVYEFWNEPNNYNFYKPKPDAPEYAKLSRLAIAAIRAGDPAAQVTTGGLATMGPGHPDLDYPFIRKFVAAGGLAGYNAFGYHPYFGFDLPERNTDQLLWVRSLVGNMPIKATESGFVSWLFRAAGEEGDGPTARKRQAVLSSRKLLTNAALGFTANLHFALIDQLLPCPAAPNNKVDGLPCTPGEAVYHANTGESTYGLFACNKDNLACCVRGIYCTDPASPRYRSGFSYRPKPSARAIKTVLEVSAGRKFRGLLQTSPGHLHAAKFESDAEVVLALWNDLPGTTIEVVLSQIPRLIYNMLGQTRSGLTSTTQPIFVSEADGPVYLVFPKAAHTASFVGQPLCADRSVPLHPQPTRMFYSDWPPNPLEWQETEPRTGPATVTVTSRTPDGVLYVGMETEDGAALPIMGTGPDALGLAAVTAFSPPTPMVEAWPGVPHSTYAINFRAPDAWCQ